MAPALSELTGAQIGWGVSVGGFDAVATSMKPCTGVLYGRSTYIYARERRERENTAVAVVHGGAEHTISVLSL